MSEREVTCPDCHGEGTRWVEIPGGRFDMSQEQWFPDEEQEVCKRCNGGGWIWYEQLTAEEKREFDDE